MVDAHLTGKEIQTKDITHLIIGGQTGVDGVQFCLASSVNGEDLTDNQLTWYLQFKNKYGQGEAMLLSPVYESNLVKLPWVPGVTATQVAGRLQIQIYATKEMGGEVVKCWVSSPAVVYVEENLDPTPIVVTEPTLLDQYLAMFNDLKNEAAQSKSDAGLSAAAALASEEAAGTSETNAGLSAAAALASEEAAGTSETNAVLSAGAALASEQASEAARDISIDAAATANRWMDIDGQPHVITRTSKNGHIIKTVSLYVEAP